MLMMGFDLSTLDIGTVSPRVTQTQACQQPDSPAAVWHQACDNGHACQELGSIAGNAMHVRAAAAAWLCALRAAALTLWKVGRC